MKPVIALVGRPNVGKSTLFNRLTQTRDAIVADFAGLTRDRHYGNGRQGRHEFIVIDTGGFEPDAGSGIFKEMAKQTRQAVAEADVVIFVVDAREGLSAQDHDIARRTARGSASPACWWPTRPRACSDGAGWSTSTSSASARCIGDLGGARAGHPRPGRLALEPLAPARARRRGRGRRGQQADQAGGRRPAQRRQVDADQHLARRGAAGRLRPARHHARCDRRARSSATASASS